MKSKRLHRYGTSTAVKHARSPHAASNVSKAIFPTKKCPNFTEASLILSDVVVFKVDRELRQAVDDLCLS